MQHPILAALVALVTVACASTPSVEAPAPPSEPNAAWLHQLVGDWECTVEARMTPDGEPTVTESTERVRPFGAWIQAEGKAEFGGEPFRSMMTLGYDAGQAAFVGTWIDTMQAHLWVYRGELDEERRTLTLAAEGPSFGDPSVMTSYRDAITVVSADERRLSSSILQDGEWITFMEAAYRRAQ